MNALHCRPPAFQKAIKALNEVDPDFGEPLACRGRRANGVNSPIGYFYSPEQQAKIAEMLEDVRQVLDEITELCPNRSLSGPVLVAKRV